MSSLMLAYGFTLLLRIAVWLSLRKWAKSLSPYLICNASPVPPPGTIRVAQMRHKCVTNPN